MYFFFLKSFFLSQKSYIMVLHVFLFNGIKINFTQSFLNLNPWSHLTITFTSSPKLNHLKI